MIHKPTYAPFIDRLISKYEGGYGWDKADPGGPTNFGITCFDLAENRGQKMTSMTAWAPLVKSMTRKEAEDIYARKYATKIQFNNLNDGPDVLLLDYAVNSGWARAVRVARSLLKVTGPTAMTPDLVAAINKVDPEKFIKAVCIERLRFMQSIRGGSAWKVFGGGWGRRVADIEQYAIALARKATPLKPEAMNVKPMPEAPKVIHGDPALATTTAKGVGGGFASSVVGHISGLPLNWVFWIGVFSVLGGIAYFMWRRSKYDAQNAAVVDLKVT